MQDVSFTTAFNPDHDETADVLAFLGDRLILILSLNVSALPHRVTITPIDPSFSWDAQIDLANRACDWLIMEFLSS